MKVAILGATGLVGRTMLNLLEGREWVGGDPVLLCSPRGAGSQMGFAGRRLECREVSALDFEDVDIALFSAGWSASRQWGPVAAEAGAWVVDNSSAWRMEDGVPLVVPEINGNLVKPVGEVKAGGIIANPNCSTIQIAMAVAPLDQAFSVREAQITTLQAVSGAGQTAVSELENQEREVAIKGESVFPRPIHRNAIPAIGPPLTDGSFEEETKVVRELRKILERGDDLSVSCTAVRVPVVTGHSAAVRLVCHEEVDLQEAAEVLARWPGVEVDADPHGYLTPLEIAGQPAVHVGRLRSDPGHRHALLLWVVADNLLKGAAWNALQIADLLAGESRP
jgi:aspartate-semialdehyde dehydrogenase